MTYVGRKHGSNYIRQHLYKAKVYVYTNIIIEYNMHIIIYILHPLPLVDRPSNP